MILATDQGGIGSLLQNVGISLTDAASNPPNDIDLHLTIADQILYVSCRQISLRYLQMHHNSPPL